MNLPMQTDEKAKYAVILIPPFGRLRVLSEVEGQPREKNPCIFGIKHCRDSSSVASATSSE